MINRESNSQDHSSTDTLQDNSQAHSQSHKGYSTILRKSNLSKRECTFPNVDHQRKNSKFKSSVSQSESSNITSSANTKQQLRITDFLSSTQENRRKRKMLITDQDHPFKHKRFKKKDNNE
jgi:hypothetical protein